MIASITIDMRCPGAIRDMAGWLFSYMQALEADLGLGPYYHWVTRTKKKLVSMSPEMVEAELIKARAEIWLHPDFYDPNDTAVSSSRFTEERSDAAWCVVKCGHAMMRGRLTIEIETIIHNAEHLEQERIVRFANSARRLFYPAKGIISVMYPDYDELVYVQGLSHDISGLGRAEDLGQLVRLHVHSDRTLELLGDPVPGIDLD
jgi:hypothetical protein